MKPSAQLPLLSLIPAGRASRPKCRLCGLPLPTTKHPRCKRCKGEFPEPGTPIHKKWIRGLRRTVEARLEALGLGRFAHQAAMSIYFGEACPEEARGSLADILAMPTSYEAWWDEADARVCATLVERKCREEGSSAEEAAAIAKEAAAWARAKKKAERAGLPPPEVPGAPKLRVEIERLRVMPQSEREAEREAMAEDESARAEERTVRQ